MTDIDIRQPSETKDLHRFLLLKTEKLSVAIHILTGHLSPAEPLRSEIRRTALKVATDAQILLDDDEVHLSDTQHLLRAVEAVLSLVYIIKGARLVSPGNAHVLEREYLELKNHFTKSDTDDIRQISHIRHHKGQSVDRTNVVPKKLMPALVTTEGATRREQILNIIDDRNSYSLGEVAIKIKGVSEKTIQRDLLSLVAEKMIKKTGERRWSRYARV